MKRRLLPFCILSLIVVSIPVLADSNTRLSFWKGIEPFGSEKQQSDERIEQAFFELSAYFETLDLWRQDFYRPIEEQPRWKELREEIQDKSFEELLASAAPNNKTLNAEGYAIHFEGRAHEAPVRHFEFSMPSTLSEIRDPELGEIQGSLNLTRGSLKESNVQATLGTQIFLDTILFSEFLASIEAVNGLFTQVDLFEEAEANNISLDDILRREFQFSLPTFMQTLEQFSRFEKFARFENTADGSIVTRITHEQKIDLNALKRHYPDTYRDFKTLLKSISFESEILTQENKRLGIIQYDTESHRFNAEFVLAKGGFMLQERNGDLTNEIILPTQLEELAYKIVNNTYVSMFGLDVSVSNLVLDAQFKANKNINNHTHHATLDMTMDTPPNIEVHGALLYIFPSWLIDLLIPGTIETLIADAFEDLIEGRHGKGVEIGMDFQETNHKHWMRVSAAAEFPFELLQAILKIEEKERSDRPRLYATLRKNLRQDFSSMANQR